jgi:hypothetical protein
VELEAARAPAAVMADDQQVEAVLVGVPQQVAGRVVARDDHVLDRHPRPVGPVAHAGERLLEVAPRGLDRLGPVARRLGAGRRVGDRCRGQVGPVAPRDVDRDVEGGLRRTGPVPGGEDLLEHVSPSGRGSGRAPRSR